MNIMMRDLKLWVFNKLITFHPQRGGFFSVIFFDIITPDLILLKYRPIRK